MKTISYIIVLFGFVFIFNSCNLIKKDKKEITIGFSQCIDNDIWRQSMDHEMSIEASLHPEINFSIYNAHRSAKNQIRDIERMIVDKKDVIIVSPYESDSIVPVIEKANLKGIPIILVDRKVNTSNFTAYLGANNVEVGRIAARHIVLMSKGQANVLEIKVESAISPGVERSLGFNQILKQYPKIKKTSIAINDYVLHKANYYKVLDSLPHTDYVFAFNDFIAYDMSKYIKATGIKNNIKFIGVDGLNGSNGGVQMVKDGVLDATVLYPTGGSEAIRLALKIANNEIVPKNNILNTTLIDSVNADIMRNQFDKITIQQSNIEQQQHVIKDQEEQFTTQNNLLKLLIVLFIIVFGLAIHSIYSRIIISRKKNEVVEKNKKIIIQKNEIKAFAKELKKGNEARLLFFTGLSHEFKTPLTLILSSLESLISEYKNKGISVNKEINLMYNNSRRLLRLINQLLDFRKLEDDKFLLRASKTNIFDFSKNIIRDFEKEAKKKKIDFSLTSNNQELEIYIDRNLMDKVYFNLLSNAFKFTPANGKISISINEERPNNMVKISFKDSGIGIPENEIKEVFKAFYQGSNNSRNSSGIGLHLSKNFIDIHKGSIEINSKNGAEFIISLPLGKEHLDEKSIISEPVLDLVNQSDYLDSEIQIVEPKNSDDKYTILYIEDNYDLLAFISHKFSTEYNLYASDGTDAIERALELIPDIIICDLNLPDKNGFEICEILKKDLRTSHIPIIILTASEDQNSNLKALESGADVFLTKPFNLLVLSQSIKSLLFNREKLRYYYSNNIEQIINNDVNNNVFSLIEQEFIKKLNYLIEENLFKSDYSVEDLAKDLSISRVQLYRKAKAIMGISISDHINNIRLEKAKHLLLNSDQNISEIAYAVGFSSPYYFSNVFKNKFGTAPKDFRK